MTIPSVDMNGELLLSEKGEVTYVAAFPGTFVSRTEAEARKHIEKFRFLKRPLVLYRIEIIEVDEPTPAEGT